MSDTINISVDGQDGDLVARCSGIRFVTPDNDLALVRVSHSENQVTAYQFQCRSHANNISFYRCLIDRTYILPLKVIVVERLTVTKTFLLGHC